jgi:DNA polymerase-3 subunit chi
MAATSKQIYFIILTSAVKQRIVCDLVEKCYLSGKRVWVYCQDESTARLYDNLLWTWKQSSFIPHVYCSEPQADPSEPVVLSDNINGTADYEYLILVEPVALDELDGFTTILDFAEKYDQAQLLKSRARFKEYSAKGYAIKSLPPGEFLHLQLP